MEIYNVNESDLLSNLLKLYFDVNEEKINKYLNLPEYKHKFLSIRLISKEIDTPSKLKDIKEDILKISPDDHIVGTCRIRHETNEDGSKEICLIIRVWSKLFKCLLDPKYDGFLIENISLEEYKRKIKLFA
jgi:hypothetical protein